MSGAVVAALLLATLSPSGVADPGTDDIVLAAHCPPSFAADAQGRCRLVTRYDAYTSVANAGVGGTRTALPPRRDGFTPREIDLGRYLFFDPILSRDGSLACASCHLPDLAFSDGRGRSVGREGHTTTRGAPSLWNSAFLHRLFWDGRAASLEEQVQGPLYSRVEMGSTPQGLLRRLRGNAAYRRLFAQAFPGSESIELEHLYRALAAFEASLVSLNSRYDRYAHGHRDSLSRREIAGLNVFRSFVARCAECHTPPLFTNQQLAVIGAPEAPGKAFDPGAGAVLGAAALRGAFKVPSLRNIAQTAPYMHSGRFATLREAVAFYNGGRGHAVPEDEDLQLHWHIWEPQLSDEEIDLIVAFLATLSDDSLLPAVPDRLPSGLSPPGGFADSDGPSTGDSP
jgi:cytochrome c peroxidase